MQKIVLTCMAVVSIFVMACNTNSSQKLFKSTKAAVSVSEAFSLLNGNALLLDVREPNEIIEQAYDVHQSLSIPLDSLNEKINLIPKDIQVIVACRSGNRSQQAYTYLSENGFTNIANLDGGILAWAEAGLPTKIGTVEKQACCSDPSSTACNPDGTCKSPLENTEVKHDLASAKNMNANRQLSTSRIEIFAFHGTRQCETCKNMKANTKSTLDTYFANELKSGKIVYQVIDVDDPKNEKLAEKFEATGTALMVNKIVNGKDNIVDWSDFAFDKANNPKEFNPELKTKISSLLK
jgi:rhodanese-related sulfurtransferase